MENTAVIFTTDHGFYHGEHGLMGKSIITEKYQGLAPLYEEVTHIPLMIHLPKIKPQRISGFVQPPDLTTTIVELAKAKDPGTMEGKSLLPLIKEKEKIRNFVVSSPSIIHGSAGGQRVTVTIKDWVFIYGLKEKEERAYETRIVDGKVRTQKSLGKKVEPELYHLSFDPGQKKNIFSKHKDIARKLHSQLIKFNCIGIFFLTFIHELTRMNTKKTII